MYVLLNAQEQLIRTYALIIFLGIVMNTIGDMFIFHMIRPKKGNTIGIILIALSYIIFGLGWMKLLSLSFKVSIYICAGTLSFGLCLYVLKKLIKRKVYYWFIPYGSCIMFFSLCSMMVLSTDLAYRGIIILGTLCAVVGGLMILMRSYFNIRFKNMAIFVWGMYIFHLLILTYSPIIIMFDNI